MSETPLLARAHIWKSNTRGLEFSEDGQDCWQAHGILFHCALALNMHA